jgi:hypothetical protein
MPLGQVLQAFVETMNLAQVHADKGLAIGNKVLDFTKNEFVLTIKSLGDERIKKLHEEVAGPTLQKIIESTAKFGLSPTSPTGKIEKVKASSMDIPVTED